MPKVTVAPIPRGAKKSGVLPEAKVHRLRERMENYGKPCRFQVGDLVTPYRDAGQVGHAEPHVVLEVVGFEDVVVDCAVGGDATKGMRLDMRVLAYVSHGRRDALMAYWVESWQYQAWTEDLVLPETADLASVLGGLLAGAMSDGSDEADALQ